MMITPPGQTPESASLGYYLHAFLRYRNQLLIVNLVVLLLVSAYVSVATPVYRSRAVLLIEPSQLNIETVAQGIYARLRADEFYETQFQLLRSRGLAASVITDLNLWRRSELQADSATPANSTQSPRKETLDRFTRRLRIKSIPSTSLITVQFDSTSPVIAARVANRLAENYLSHNVQQRGTTARQRLANLEEVVSQLDEALQSSESELRDFHAQYPELAGISKATSVQSASGRALSEPEALLLTSLPGLLTAQTEVSRLGAQLNTAQQDIPRPFVSATTARSAPVLSGEDGTVVSGSSEQDDVALSLHTALMNKQRKLARLVSRFGPQHPRRQAAQGEIDSLERSLASLAEVRSAELRRQHALAETRLNRLEQDHETTRATLQGLESARKTLNFLTHRHAREDALHRNLFKRLQAQRNTGDLLASEATLVERASVPPLPIHPQRLILTALAMITALIFSFIATGIAARLDNRVKSYRDLFGLRLQGLASLPRVGKLPIRLPLLKSSRTPLVPEPGNQAFNPVREAVDSLRMVLSGHDRAQQVILVTSSVPGEGKSSVSLALAAACKRAGERVLLIDCDLRRPAIGQVAGVARGADGLSSLLSGSSSAASCINTNLLGLGIDFLNAGPATAAPGQLLTSARFAELLNRLRGDYDRIVVDTPPILAVSDALPLSRLSDGVLYVVHSHRTTRACVECGISRLRQAKAPLAGYVLSQVPEKPASYFTPKRSLVSTLASVAVRARKVVQTLRSKQQATREVTSLCHRLHDDLAVQQLEASLAALPADSAPSRPASAPTPVSDLHFDIDLNLGSEVHRWAA